MRRWLVDFWGRKSNLSIIDELAEPDMVLRGRATPSRRRGAGCRRFGQACGRRCSGAPAQVGEILPSESSNRCRRWARRSSDHRARAEISRGLGWPFDPVAPVSERRERLTRRGVVRHSRAGRNEPILFYPGVSLSPPGRPALLRRTFRVSHVSPRMLFSAHPRPLPG